MAVLTYVRITVLFFVLTGLLMLLGYAIGYAIGADPLTFMLLGLVFAALLNFVTYFFSDTIVVKMSRARIISENENPTLFNIVRKVASEAKIPMPKVGIVDSMQPNAFATGRGPHKAVVVATSGILNTLTPSELEAVIGHEVGHVVHRDVLVSSVAATIAGVISFIGNMALWSSMAGGLGGRRQNNGSLLAILLAAIFIPLGAMFVQLGISRSFEYNADEYGAKLTHNPGGLINALEKISNRVNSPYNRGSSVPSSTASTTASLWIVNPLRGHTLMELFSTHPSTNNRVKRLRRIAEEMGVYVR